MRVRNEQGKFVKKEEENSTFLMITLPKLSLIMSWIILILIFLPWIIIIFKAELPSRTYYWCNYLLFNQTTPNHPVNNGGKDASESGYWSK